MSMNNSPAHQALNELLLACSLQAEVLQQQAQAQVALWEDWLQPVANASDTGEDPAYNDDFQLMREEVNKLSGADTGLICQLAEKLLTTVAKDIRVATYYLWARLQREGETGLADGLTLLTGLLQRYGVALHPQRERGRKAALEWLAGQRVLDSLSFYPEVTPAAMARALGALLLLEQSTAQWMDESRPDLRGFYNALIVRLEKSGGLEAVVPQNGRSDAGPSSQHSHAPPPLGAITSGRALLEQVRVLAGYLYDKPDGWLAAHHLMKSVRHDTLHQLPPLAADGRTRIDSPKPDQRALLKRLYLQQSWLELLEQADGLFSRGACHLWLDIQWYLYQALSRAGSPYEGWAEIIARDLKGLLTRLPGLETLAFNDGTPFADEVTQSWITQQVLKTADEWRKDARLPPLATDDDVVLQLEAEAVRLADGEGPEAALNWLQQRPGIATARNRWLLRLLMARVADQYGRNEMALHLLNELESQGSALTLMNWEPALLFEVKARRLKLLRAKAGRSEADKMRLQPAMEQLLAGLIALEPARAMVLCG